MKTKVILTALVFVASVAFATAQKPQNENRKSETPQTCFVDTNENGVCDRYESGVCIGRGNGICLQNESAKASGKETNGRNSKNSNASVKTNSKGRWNAIGQRANNNSSIRRKFVDANNNGICDNREALPSKTTNSQTINKEKQ